MTVMETFSAIPSEIQERHQVMMESIEDIMTTTAVDKDARQKGAISSLPGYTKQQLAELQGQGRETNDGVEEHKNRLDAAFELAGQRLAKAAGIRKDRHDRKGNDTPLKPDDRVFLINRCVLGRNKIQDRWVPSLIELRKG